ncbi:MAG TPA: hypothetical protein VMH87_16525 [Pseudomonadales bacterium]|nr:hypothetical protein [Pseudomonadales bacterium]
MATQVDEREIEKLIKNIVDGQRGRVLIKRIRCLLEAPSGGFFPRHLFEEMEGFARRKGLAGQISKKLQKYYADHLSKLKIDKLVDSAKRKFDKEWKSYEKRLAIAPGADVIAEVFQHFNLSFNKTTDAPRIARQMVREDLDKELNGLLESIRIITNGNSS